MGYTSYYRLCETPFSPAVDPRFYFDAPPHAAAFFRLAHAIDRAKGLALLVGADGAGKTTLARRLLDRRRGKHNGMTFLLTVRADLTSLSLLRQVALMLKADTGAADTTAIFTAVHDRLLDLARQRRKVVILIDDTERLEGKEVLSGIHGFLNMESERGMPLNFILFGRPAVEAYLQLDPGLFQRIAVRCRLDPLDERATHAYVAHRLRSAGGSECLFDREALRAVYFHSRGNPRRINAICENALLEGGRLRREQIDTALVDTAAQNLGFLKRPD